MLSDRMRMDYFLGGSREESTRKTAFASSMLMCSWWSGAVQVPHTEFPWEHAPTQPELDASVQTVRVGGRREIGVGDSRFLEKVHHWIAFLSARGKGT